MSVNIIQHAVSSFSTNVQLLLQQKGSKLRPYVTEGMYVGKAASPVDQIGAVEMQTVTGRFGPMGRVDAAVDRRWVYPVDYDLPQLVDHFDKLRTLTDPESALVQSAVFAAGRKMDDVLISAYFADAKTGETGGTTTQFGTGLTTSGVGNRNVPVAFEAAAATGLTVAKLREGKRALMAAQVDVESDPLTCAITAKQHDDLLKEIQIVNLDYNDRPILKEGKIDRFLGINFVHCERLVTGTDNASGTSRAVPLWARSGMHLGIWNDVETAISQREDLQGRPWQAYLKMTIGATRIEENKVLRVWCRE